MGGYGKGRGKGRRSGGAEHGKVERKGSGRSGWR